MGSMRDAAECPAIARFGPFRQECQARFGTRAAACTRRVTGDWPARIRRDRGSNLHRCRYGTFGIRIARSPAWTHAAGAVEAFGCWKTKAQMSKGRANPHEAHHAGSLRPESQFRRPARRPQRTDHPKEQTHSAVIALVNSNEGLDLRGIADDKPDLWRAMLAIDV